MRILIILQNAWSPTFAHRRWPRASWLAALHRSRSGQRLKRLTDELPEHTLVEFDNTTARVAPTPSGVCPPDLNHLNNVIKRFEPTAIVTCGKQAAKAILQTAWGGPVLSIPHPAYRVVTNKLLTDAGKLLKMGFFGRVHMVQERDGVRFLPGDVVTD